MVGGSAGGRAGPRDSCDLAEAAGQRCRSPAAACRSMPASALATRHASRAAACRGRKGCRPQRGRGGLGATLARNTHRSRSRRAWSRPGARAPRRRAATAGGWPGRPPPTCGPAAAAGGGGTATVGARCGRVAARRPRRRRRSRRSPQRPPRGAPVWMRGPEAPGRGQAAARPRFRRRGGACLGAAGAGRRNGDLQRGLHLECLLRPNRWRMGVRRP